MLKNKKIFLPLIFTLISFGIAGGLYLYGSGKLPFLPGGGPQDSGDQVQPGDFSEEVYEEELRNYDVTKTKAVFAVERVNEDGTFLLRFIFPLVRQDKTVVAKIECPASDTVVTEFSSQTKELTTDPAAKPISEMIDIQKDTLQGICGDDFCTSLVKSCELVREVE